MHVCILPHISRSDALYFRLPSRSAERVAVERHLFCDRGSEPHVVMACAGDVPTLETLAAVNLLRQHFPELKVRTVNIVDLMTLQPKTEHPSGLSDIDFDALFTRDKPVIFAFH